MNRQQELSKYRMSEAERCLQSAKVLFETGDFKSAANRSYYCVFNAIRSIFALHGRDYKKHRSLLSFFRLEYVKTGILDTKLSDIVGILFQIREKSDYDDFYIVSKQEISEQIENAEYFLNQISLYLSTLDEK